MMSVIIDDANAIAQEAGIEPLDFTFVSLCKSHMGSTVHIVLNPFRLERIGDGFGKVVRSCALHARRDFF